MIVRHAGGGTFCGEYRWYSVLQLCETTYLGEFDMSAKMDSLANENPNFGEHLRDWQIARTQNNEDSYAWSEFREHELRLGAPDPGDEEPEEFRHYNWTEYAPVSQTPAQDSWSGRTDSSSSSNQGSSSASAGSASSGASAGNPSAGLSEHPNAAKATLDAFLKNLNPFHRR